MMVASRVRVRFAPSPTGELHVGNARTALFNWLFARHHGGDFILRIEDTDRIRTEEVFEKNLLDDLKWLGINWDEGPGVGGVFGPYRQSERFDLYRQCLKELIRCGRVYPCFCTEGELEAQRADLVARRMMPRYLGKCRNLTDAQRSRMQSEGRVPLWRFRVEEGEIAFNDLIRGAMVFQGGAIGDFVIVRSNGIPAYNFAVVVDDHLMEISHVLRGEDHLSNTAVQLLLYRALSFAPPIFAHHALILGKDHTKLSKRHGAVSVREFRRRGILPEVLVNYLALLGGSLAGGKEIASAEELVKGFSLDRMGKSGAVFDEEKLLWLNGIYLRRYDVKTLTDLLLPFMREAGYCEKLWERGRIEAIVETVRDNLSTLADIGGLFDLFAEDRYRMEEEAAILLRQEEARQVLLALRELLKAEFVAGEDGKESVPGPPGTRADVAFPVDSFASLIRRVGEKSGYRGKKLYLPIRAAVTGRLHGPELDRIFALLGPVSILRRIEKAHLF